MKTPNFKIIRYTNKYILIQDIGPWDKFPTVTNGAEKVVDMMLEILDGRRLFYIDSDNVTSELVIKDGKFDGFASITSRDLGKDNEER